MTQKIKTFNAIAEKGLNILQEKKFEVSDGLSDPDAIILRSHKLKKEDFGNNLKDIARAGAGVNNIPVEECSELGIPVFNTPWSIKYRNSKLRTFFDRNVIYSCSSSGYVF